MNTINDRIELLIKALGFKSADGFDKAFGRSRSVTSNITGPKKIKPGADYLAIIREKFPEVNGSWLLNGDGDMLYPHKQRKEYIEDLERKLAEAERANRRYETMIDMAAQRRESNFQQLSKRTPAREIVVLFAKNTAKSA